MYILTTVDKKYCIYFNYFKHYKSSVPCDPNPVLFTQDSVKGQAAGSDHTLVGLMVHSRLTRASQKSLVLTCARPPETRGTKIGAPSPPLS